MKIKKTLEVEVPVGLWAVTFDLVWGSPCNDGEHSDCLSHGCMDNEPTYVADAEGTVTQVSETNYSALGVEGMDVSSNQADRYDDTHDFRTRLFETEAEAREYLEYTLNRFRNPQPWESFVRCI